MGKQSFPHIGDKVTAGPISDPFHDGADVTIEGHVLDAVTDDPDTGQTAHVRIFGVAREWPKDSLARLQSHEFIVDPALVTVLPKKD